MKNYLFDHTNEETALIIKDYPYGFTLRTQIRYWLETTSKKGDRFCSQTLNPKTDRWNAAKKSTYYAIGVMFNDEKGHIHWSCVHASENKEKVKNFIEEIGGIEKLNTDQKVIFNQIMGIQPIVQDEFTGKAKKDFAVKWEKNRNGKICEVRITFDRPDGVRLIEIFNAMKTLNQDKLNEVFEIKNYGSLGNHTGTVRICVRGGMQLGTISEESYKNFLASDTNILNENQ